VEWPISLRNAHIERMAATLRDWAGRLAALRAQARRAGGEHELLVSRQMASLHYLWRDYATQMNDAHVAGTAALPVMQERAEHVAAEFERTLAQAASRFAA
jgi:hypothetical protein